MLPRIFISYRREESEHQASRLFEALAQILPGDYLFKDTHSISAGDDFVATLESRVANSDILLALIADKWIDVRDPKTGKPKLQAPDDWVRSEIRGALSRRALVVPVLLDGAKIPEPDQLPDDIRKLSRLQAAFVESRTFHADVATLIEHLKLPESALQGSDATGLPNRYYQDKLSAPFVGRTAVFDQLDAWLVDPDTASNLLLCAPAGQGKSTTIVQWIERLARHEPAPATVFVPITRTYGLGREFEFFPALAAKLQPYLPLALKPPKERDQARKFVQAALEALARNETPLVLIIDGLDEAEGWTMGPDIFPTVRRGHPLRIVATARTEADDPSGQGWLFRLGWKPDTPTISLPALTTDEVKTLLAGSAKKIFASRELEQTAAGCGGDPLIAQLLAQAIANHSFDTSNFLDHIDDPLTKVVKSWYERTIDDVSDTIKPAVTSFLSALIAARGPLTRADLSIILDVRPGQLHEVIKAVRTIVAGSTESGYTFAHPRLADTLGRMFGTRDADIDRGFVRLIEAAREQAAAQNFLDVSLYALRHCAAHLSTSEASSRLIADLLDPDWLKAHLLRFKHSYWFIDLTDATAELARIGNVRAAAKDDILPRAELEFTAVFWRAVAAEYSSIEADKIAHETDEITSALERIRGELYPDFPPSSAPTKELAALLDLRERIDPAARKDWAMLAETAVDRVLEHLFSYGVFDVEEAIGLITALRPDFDIASFVDSLNEPSREREGRLYLLKSGSPTLVTTQAQRLQQIGLKTSSLKEKAEIAVALTIARIESFDPALQCVLRLAATDHDSARTAASLAEKLLDGALPADAGIDELLDIIDRFQRATGSWGGSEARLVGAAMRHSPTKDRRAIWKLFGKFQYSSDLTTILEGGPNDWTSNEVDELALLLGGRTSRPRPTDIVTGWKTKSEGAHPAWRFATGIANILGALIGRTTGPARRTAMERILDNLELIPVSDWWPEPAAALDRAILPMLHAGETTDVIRSRAAALAVAYETNCGEPLAGRGKLPSGLYDLSSEAAAAHLVEFINRWGDEGLKGAESCLTGHLANSDAWIDALDEIGDTGLRLGAAKLTARNQHIDAARRETLMSRIDLSDEARRRHRDRLQANRKLLLELAQSFSLATGDSTAWLLRWLLRAGSDGHALLRQLEIPDGWVIPADLIARVLAVAWHWNFDEEGSDYNFPKTLVGRLPAANLVELTRNYLADSGLPGAYVVGALLEIVTRDSIGPTIERDYVLTLSRAKLSWRDRLGLDRYLVNALPILHDPEQWAAFRISCYQGDDKVITSGLVRAIFSDCEACLNDALRRSLAKWVLDHIDAVTDPIHRAQIRHTLKSAADPQEIDASRQLLNKALAGKTTEEEAYGLGDTFQALIATDIDGRWRPLVDAFIARESTRDNFYRYIESLGDQASLDNVTTALPLALELVTYTGTPWPARPFFCRLPPSNRDAAFLEWLNELDTRDNVENKRRCLRVLAGAATPEFALEVLKDLLRVEVDHSFWSEPILALIEQVSSEGAESLVTDVACAARAHGSDKFILALQSRLSKRQLSKTLPILRASLSVSSSRKLLAAFGHRHPELLDSIMIDELLDAAENDKEIAVSWISDAPAATMVQQDRAWAILLSPARGANLAGAVPALRNAVRLRQRLGGTDEEMFAAMKSATSVF